MNEELQPARRGVRLTRRRLILLAAGGAALVAVPARVGFYDEGGLDGLRHLSIRQGAILLALLDALLPPFADRSREALEDHVRFIDGYLGHVPDSARRDLPMLLYGVEHLTLPYGGALRRASRLDRAARARCLLAWQTSRFGLLRLGLRSLASMAFLALYRSEDAFRAIGYSGPAMPPGWEGPEESRARYAALLAPAGARPAFGEPGGGGR